jgi:phospholipase C
MLDRLDQGLGRWHLRHRDRAADEAGRPHSDREMGTAGGADRIDHIVVLMMENHSFDNYFGTLGIGEGLTKEAGGAWGPPNRTAGGEVVRPHHLASTVQVTGSPTQSWAASHIQWGDGANDGFVHSVEETVPGADPRLPMGFWTEEDLPFYASLARTFGVADRWHSSLLGPTFPNRRFLIAATANGLIDDVMISLFDYPRSGTLFDLLDRHRISWANYHHVAGWRLIAKRAFGAAGVRGFRRLATVAGRAIPAAVTVGTDNLQFTANLYPLGIWRCLRHLRPIERFFADAAAGTLPAVSIVDPDLQRCSEENPQDVQVGEGFAAAVINAVMNGKGWAKTILVWLYDEHGGYFDHVPPPPAVPPDAVAPRSLLKAGPLLRWVLRPFVDWSKLARDDAGGGGFDRYGFRVPAAVISPYSKPGHVSSVLYDHASVLKLIEWKWNLPPLTARDRAAANPADDMLDFDRAPFLEPPGLAEPARPWSP